MRTKSGILLVCFILLIPLIISAVAAQPCTQFTDCNDCNSWTIDTCSLGQCQNTALKENALLFPGTAVYREEKQKFFNWMEQQGYAPEIINVYKQDLNNGELAQLLMKKEFGMEPSFALREIGRTILAIPATSQNNFENLIYRFKHDDTFTIDFVELTATDPNIINIPFDEEQLTQFEVYLNEKFKRKVRLNHIIQPINYQQTFADCAGCSMETIPNQYQRPGSDLNLAQDTVTITGFTQFKGGGVGQFLRQGNCEDNGKIYANAGRWIQIEGKYYDIAFPTNGEKGCNAAVGSLLNFNDPNNIEASRWTHEFAHVLGIPHMVWNLYYPYVSDPLTGKLEVQRYMFGTDSLLFIPGYVGAYRPGFNVDSRGYHTMIEEFDPFMMYVLEPVNGYDTANFAEEYSTAARYTTETLGSYRQQVCGFGTKDACFNGQKDGMETSTDCGGVCPECPCTKNTDCTAAEECKQGLCLTKEEEKEKLEQQKEQRPAEKQEQEQQHQQQLQEKIPEEVIKIRQQKEKIAKTPLEDKHTAPEQPWSFWSWLYQLFSSLVQGIIHLFDWLF